MSRRAEQDLIEDHKKLEVEKAKINEEKKQLQEQRAQLAKESQEWAKWKSLAQSSAQGSSVQEQKTESTMSGIMGTIGSVREYSLNEDFELWFEQFEEYVAANNIPAARYHCF